MKAKVVLSLLLLALAAALWSWQPPTPATPPEFARLPQRAAEQGQALETADPLSHSPSGHDVLASAINQLRKSPPFMAQIKLQIDLLNREFLGTGQYTQAGMGTPQTRWDLQLDGIESKLFLSQIFDGRFFYRLEILGAEKTLSYVDLDAVRNLPNATAAGVAGPLGWFGTGGLATMLEQIAATFEFEPNLPKQQIESPGSQPMAMTIVRGQWSREGLAQLLRDQISPEVLGAKIRWDLLPGQLPHSVDLYFGSDDYLQDFPYQLIFYQFVRSGTGEYSRHPIFKLQLHNVEKKEAIAPEQFRISAADLNPIDLSKDYVERIKLFTQHPLRR